MSAFGMHPKFNDHKSYRAWIVTWRQVHRKLTATIRARKIEAKNLQRTGGDFPKAQKELHYERVMGHKLMTLLKDAKARWGRILAMKQQISEQMAKFPLLLDHCPVVDVHFNRGHNDFPEYLPMWIVKAKGQVYYIHHIEFDQVSFSTRELAEGSTRGMLRFRHCSLRIDPEGGAQITQIGRVSSKVA